MMDKKLVFCEEQSATAAFTSDSIDFGHTYPTTGLNDRQLYVVAKASGTEVEGDSASVTFNIQSSEDDSTFETVLSVAGATAEMLNMGFAVPMPIRHDRYVRVNMTVTTAPSAGTIDVFLSDVFDLPRVYPMEGVEYIQTVD